MRVYFVFDLKKEYINLYKGNERVLYNILKQIYYLEKEDAKYGYNLFNQLINKIEKDVVDRFIFLKLHQTIPYSKRGCTHYMNNLYKDEVSRLIVKNSYIKIEAEQYVTSFFDVLTLYYKDFFVCDFKNQDFFFLSDIKHLSKDVFFSKI